MIDFAAFGAAPAGERLKRLERSKHRDRGHFRNDLPVENDMGRALMRWLRGAPNREPKEPVPVVARTASSFDEAPPSGLRVTWLGHSSMLVEIGRQRFLTDPVFSHRISPSPLLGPRRFFESPIGAAELPRLDAVVLSHDHFDHLDMKTIQALAASMFVVPLGVGAHLEAWGIAPARIVELDWWESTRIGEVELVCTPARHFSGRSIGSRDVTLWAGWAFVGRSRRVFFSGDTGMFPGFEAIGSSLGPFDLTMIESGAYDPSWADVHLGPEQAVRAHEMLQGRLMLPVHWGTYNLALHGWTEPAERVLACAGQRARAVVIPRPGESFDPLAPPDVERWWPELGWQSAEASPVVSSHLPWNAAPAPP